MPSVLRQRGAALVVGLIMLVLMMLLAITSIELGRGSAVMTGNLQFRNEATAAANGALEDAISTPRMVQAPDAVYLRPCTTANTKCVDTNADGVDDIVVALRPSPRCIQATAISNSRLNFAIAAQRACAVGQQQSLGIEGSASGASLCARSIWDLNAVATDAVTQAEVHINTGVGVVIPTETIGTACV